MKATKITISILLNLVMICSGMILMAQAPEKVSYQSVIRDASGELVRSQMVGIQISILRGSASGTESYKETHTPTTNINGLATIEVGNGTPVFGAFDTINWGNGSYFLQVETDPAGGTTYTITGSSEILSVPYAIHAKTADTIIGDINEIQTLADVLAEDNIANEQIKNVTDPTDDQDAATKAYVDEMLSTIQVVQTGFVDSRDGNHYNTVLIGTQVWMAENLAYLPSVSPPEDGSEDGVATDPYYYVYDYSGTDVSVAKAESNYETYGVLYNWPAALTACPSGWHLPSDAEWTTLEDYLTTNAYGYEGSGDDIGKAMAYTSGWTAHATPGNVGNDQASNNSSGFSALPGGHRVSSGSFDGVGYYGFWWSAAGSTSSYAWSRYLGYLNSGVARNSISKDFGFSARCLRD